MTKKQQTAQYPFRTNKKIYERLKAEAKAQDKSVNKILERLCDEHLPELAWPD